MLKILKNNRPTERHLLKLKPRWEQWPGQKWSCFTGICQSIKTKGNKETNDDVIKVFFLKLDINAGKWKILLEGIWADKAYGENCGMETTMCYTWPNLLR